MYINDLHNAIKFPQTIHYVDDPCLLINEKKSKINKLLTKDFPFA